MNGVGASFAFESADSARVSLSLLANLSAIDGARSSLVLWPRPSAWHVRENGGTTLLKEIEISLLEVAVWPSVFFSRRQGIY